RLLHLCEPAGDGEDEVGDATGSMSGVRARLGFPRKQTTNVPDYPGLRGLRGHSSHRARFAHSFGMMLFGEPEHGVGAFSVWKMHRHHVSMPFSPHYFPHKIGPSR